MSISSDHLFQVRNKQRYTNETPKPTVLHLTKAQPSHCEEVHIGDICL